MIDGNEKPICYIFYILYPFCCILSLPGTMDFLRNKLANRQRLFQSSLVKGLFVFIFLLLLTALIVILTHQRFRVNDAGIILGLILFITGFVLWYRQQTTASSPHVSTSAMAMNNFGHNFDSYPNLDNYQLPISPHTPEIQHIIIRNQPVKISVDITQILESLRDVLQQTITQATNPVIAIQEFAQDLQTQLSQNPELKLYLCVDGDCHEPELVNQILKLLLIPPVYPIQKLDQHGNIVKIEYLEDDKCVPDHCIILYKGYRINLHQNQNKAWAIRIQRPDLSFLELRRIRKYRKKANAIAVAQKHIRADIFREWQQAMKII